LSISPQNEGRGFEKEISDEFKLSQTPASGAFWSSKLDLFGFKSRWSAKFTAKRSFRLTQDDVEEAIKACLDGSVPIWIIRIGEERYDIVAMRKEDFKSILSGDIRLEIETSGKSAQKRKRSGLPILLRETEGENDN
jgi:hypothetical protein